MAGADDTKFEFSKIADGIAGAEGPVFDTKGNFYMVAPSVEKNGKHAGQVLKVDLNTGKTTLVCEPSVGEDGGVPAGCQCDKEGNIYVADMRLGILKVTPSGQYQQLFKVDSEGRTMQGCNDCSFDYNGNLWVTGPAGDIAPSEYRRSFEAPFGSVYCLTKPGKVIRIDTGLWFPNGLAVRHDESGEACQLIVAETPTKLLWSYDIKGPGLVSNKREWAKLPGNLEGGADGMDFDDKGNLLVAHWGTGHIEVFSPEGGSPAKRIPTPFKTPSNLHFQPKSRTVYMTEHDNNGLWKFEWETCGMPQFCEKE
ncbi:diisopropyl-fluorophosphatase-like [Littorina saxatilis]|uniref:SMP-30/Gluconolactonase/LRE-like region domain-containing protein n=1 Tax=Littorina saxatilis TaxID=31220 RepID=A0AAN9B712_9CAEN